MKKTISILLSILIAFTMLPSLVFADDIATSGSCGDNLTWSFDAESGALSIEGYGSMNKYNTSDNLAPWNSFKDQIKTISFNSSSAADSISILDYAFFKSNVEEVDLNNCVNFVGYAAFEGCYSLKTVKNTSKLSSIGQYAFSQCKHLFGITIPSNASVESDALYRVRNVQYTGTADKGNWGMLSVNGYIEGDFAYEDDTKATIIMSSDSLENVIIPSTVTKIDDKAFVYSENLKSISIPDSVTYIGKSAFGYCDGLTSIVIPDSVTFIGDYAFSNCNYLENVTLGSGVTRIGFYTFFQCFRLFNLDIPSSVEYINANAFNDVPSVTTHSDLGNYAPWGARICNGYIENGVVYDSSAKKKIYAIENKSSVFIPSSVTKVDADAIIYLYNLTDIYYEGTEEQFDNINFAGKQLRTIHYNCAEEHPTSDHVAISEKAIPATMTTAGATGKTYCKLCGKTLTAQKAIAKISTVKLSATTYTYDGKVKTPSVVVKDSTGKALVKNTDYTVSYASGRKNVGKYSVKITFKGNYSGTKSLSFAIVPKTTSISSLSAISKGFTAKWKKQATQTTGYQIQIATDSKFTKGVKNYTVSKNSTVSKKITKLTGKKKYYVRIRTYKTVNKVKYYSSWSASKYVTTKK